MIEIITYENVMLTIFYLATLPMVVAVWKISMEVAFDNVSNILVYFIIGVLTFASTLISHSYVLARLIKAIL